MRVEGRAHVFGDNVTTDEIAPTRLLMAVTEASVAGKHFMGNDPAVVQRIRSGDVLVAGWNYGCGSSRETAPLAIKGAGISCVIAKTFARTFFRNCINQGLPLLECPEAADAIRPGDLVSADISTGEVRVGDRVFRAAPYPPFLLGLIEKGGIVGWVKEQLAAGGE